MERWLVAKLSLASQVSQQQPPPPVQRALGHLAGATSARTATLPFLSQTLLKKGLMYAMRDSIIVILFTTKN